MNMLKLNAIYTITGTITAKTGLRIGGNEAGMHIGGVDNPVIRDAHTGWPYIPGSSLKGKMRSLLEQASGHAADAGGSPLTTKVLEMAQGPDRDFVEKILKAFGVSGSEENELGPTRLAFADAMLDTEYAESILKRGKRFTEIKTETAIDRIKGTAKGGSLRQTERIVPGARFRFRITFRDLMEGDRQIVEELVLPGLRLLSLDALGGSVSRGYGAIDITIDDDCMLGDKKVKDLFEAIKDPFKHLPGAR